MSKINLSAPWVTRYREIEALFREDPDIHIVYDEENNTVKLYVDNQDKVAALESLLPQVYQFGNVDLHVEIIPANDTFLSRGDMFAIAFQNNPVLSRIASAPSVFTNPMEYVVFKNKVVQYYNDDISDIHGNCSTLYQEIAKNVFGEQDGVYFNTDTPE